MKKIVVPVDFSEISEHALLYAIQLCKISNSSLHALHVLNPETNEADEQKKGQEAENKLKALQTKAEHAGDLKFTYRIVKGEPIKEIVHYSRLEKANMIVMGTKGESNLPSMVFGSNAANVISSADCPVFAIPENVPFKLPKKITFATDYHPSDINILKFILEQVKAPGAQLNILHVALKNEDPAIEKLKMEELMQEATQKIDYNNFSFQLKAGDDINEEILKYIASDAADLFVTSTRQRNFWEKYFNEGVTRNIIRHSAIPILAFHHKQNTSVKLFNL